MTVCTCLSFKGQALLRDIDYTALNASQRIATQRNATQRNATQNVRLTSCSIPAKSLVTCQLLCIG
jgi:hypothetical protein